MTKNINTVILANAIQVGLFNDILLGQIINPDGRWNGVRTKGHAEPFMTAKARVAKEGEALGLTFAAPKRNYNFNDSGWVNPAEQLEKLMAVAKKANGGKEVTKKQLAGELEAIKNIFKASAQPAAAVVAEAAGKDAKVVETTPAQTA